MNNKKSKHIKKRGHPLNVLVDRALFLKANGVREVPWPEHTEAMLRAVAAGVDIDFLREIAAQAIIALENKQKERYRLIARRLRKALSLKGASNETMVMASEAVYVRPVVRVEGNNDGSKKDKSSRS